MARLLPRGRTHTNATDTAPSEHPDHPGTDPGDHPGSRRPFRLDTRLRRLTAAGTAGLLVAALGVPALSAWGDEDDLKHRRSQVSDRLQDARGDLRHSSRALNQAARRLEVAQSRLDTARGRLQATRAELADARKYDLIMQERLEQAEERLQRARQQLVRGKEAVLHQRRRLAGFAADSFQDSDNQLLQMRVFLHSQTPESLTTQLDAVDSISTKQSNSYARLKASEVLLKVNEDEVEAAKKEVAAQRAAAARNLERKRQLKVQAQAAKDRVAELVSARRSARLEANEAKRDDLVQVHELEAERQQIQDRLAEIARRRREAIARARARAAAERAASARAAARASRSAPRVDSGLMAPVDSYITSSYGMRYHPILHYRKLHDGTDFGVGCGTPVRAADSGRVLSTYYSTGYGNQLLIDHGIERGVSLSTSYNHLSSFAVSPGEQVQRGEVVAYSGTTGYSTGCHLHFMVYENGSTVDPMSWL